VIETAPADTGDAVLDGLTGPQRQAVVTSATPLCVLAGAGAGKTRVLTRRIAYRVRKGSAAPSRVLALTFTRKAAAELHQRLALLGLRDRLVAGTFHAVAAAELRRFWADRGQRAPALLDRKARLLGPLAAERPGLASVPIADLVAQVEWAHASAITPDGFEEAAAHRTLPAPAAEVAALYRRYEHEKRRRGLVDFDDLLARCAGAIATDPTFAAAQRWRWRHFFVDEFQDLNPLQYRLLLAWMGDRTDLCAVGDPNQAIYGWNGADPGLLAGLPERWPGAVVVRLDDNHRSSPQVVAAGAAVLGRDAGPLRSRRADGPPPQVRTYGCDADEATGVARQVGDAHAGGLGWGAMAVLVRTNAQIVPLRRAFDAAGIPTHLPAGAALLEDPAVSSALADLHRRSELPFAMFVADLDTSTPALAALSGLAGEYLGLDPNPTASGFRAWLPAAAGPAPGGAGDAVTLSSFHRAKGLEWPAVWVCGLERGLVPFGRDPSPPALAEERRLLYVALTRAKRELRCSWASARSFGSRPVPRQPSPWLEAIRRAAGQEVGQETVGAPEVADVAAWRARLADQRARLRAPADGTGPDGVEAGPGGRRAGRGGRSLPASALPPPDPERLEALRAWRAQRARAAGVPAHVVLHDRTLAVLAALAPATEEDLVDVPGLGPIHAARFGASLLAALRKPVPA
jgi:DNA helicase II / ATP-dependent DNA helicase PcrA